MSGMLTEKLQSEHAREKEEWERRERQMGERQKDAAAAREREW